MQNNNKFPIFLLLQLVVPAIIGFLFQQIYSLQPSNVIAHFVVVFFVVLIITLIGLFLSSRIFKEIYKGSKYIIAALFGLLNILLYYTYLFAFLGEHFNSKIFTLQIVLGYLRFMDQFIANFSINPVLVYSLLIIVPALIFIGCLLIRNKIYRDIISTKAFLKKHHFNNPSRIFKVNIILFLFLVGVVCGVLLVSYKNVPFLLFEVEEPITTVFFRNKNPLGSKIYADTNEDIGVRNAYPKNIDFDEKNVVIIVVDALRSDHLSLFGYDRKTSPFLDSLYATGNLRKVDLSFSVSAESFPGINAILRSKIWTNLGYSNFSLQHLLKDQGYNLNFIISGDHTNFYDLKSFYGKNSDFNYYIDGSITKRYKDPNDDRILLEGLKEIAPYKNSPTYFHFHLMSVHNLGVRLNNFKVFQPAGSTTFDTTNYINRYDNGVLQADYFIKQLFQELSKKGYLENSIVVITGDHGEALGEKGLYGHGRSIYTNQILTPILIYDTEKVEYNNLNYATLVDVAPTIVDRLGLPIPETWEGVSLFSEKQNRQLTYHQENTEYAIIHNQDSTRYKLIYNSKTDTQELYELNSDLYERNNLIDSIDREYINTLRWYINEFHIDPEKLYR